MEREARKLTSRPFFHRFFGGSGQAANLQPARAAGTIEGLQDEEHDALLALAAWVENGSAPASIVATTWNADGAVNRTRPICAYPARAVYRGSGDENSAANWQCQ